MVNKLTLILGGVRSGKSSFAISLAKQRKGKVTYLATGTQSDPEMRERIKKHKAFRPSHWGTIEANKDLLTQIEAVGKKSDLVILDCLGAFATGLLMKQEGQELLDLAQEKQVESQINQLIKTIRKLDSEVIVVSNEVGQGVVPPYPLGRSFRDLLGLANQRLAGEAETVYLMVAGIPIPIKKGGNEG